MKIPILLLILAVSYASSAQENVPLYPQDYFRNPLNIPLLLAGNFGECRSGHFHSGLDIKTRGVENYRVYAAAEGFVSRIKIEKYGFGHALYIHHPNGLTTVYAHLSRFAPLLQRYVKQWQYENEQWALDLKLSPDQFPVAKGDLIAWSGNTGGSMAPHLHFEIRETRTEHPLNPLLFGFDIKDSRAPVPTHISLYNLSQSIYDQTPDILPLNKISDGKYNIRDTVFVQPGRTGLGIHVNDYMDNSHNTLNFYIASWYQNDRLMGKIRLDDIGYEETRYLHAYTDYRLHHQGKGWYQLFFRLPGNRLLSIYPFLQDDGALQLNPGAAAQIRLDIQDASGNTTVVTFTAKATIPKKNDPCTGLSFYAGKLNSFQSPNVMFQLPETALYHDICFHFKAYPASMVLSDKYQIHRAEVPLHNYFLLRIKANKPISFALRDKIALQYQDSGRVSGQQATFEDGWYSASVRKFGTYWLEIDTTAPEIRSLQPQNANLKDATRLAFRVSEDQTSVASFRAELDGKWLCFAARKDIFFYELDEHCPPGKHTLKVVATDENGNRSIFHYAFSR